MPNYDEETIQEMIQASHNKIQELEKKLVDKNKTIQELEKKLADKEFTNTFLATHLGNMMALAGNVGKYLELSSQDPIQQPQASNRNSFFAPSAPPLPPFDPTPDFICPISQEIMRDPVVAADGHTYEKKEIERWFQNHDTSPSTNIKLRDKSLRPNVKLKSLIEDYQRHIGADEGASASSSNSGNISKSLSLLTLNEW